MNTVVARVLRVLTGDSSAAMVHAIDENGLEHKLEIPTAVARAVLPGRLLVLQWSVHDAPDAIADAPTVPPNSTPSPASSAETTAPKSAERQLAELLGLRLTDGPRNT